MNTRPPNTLVQRRAAKRAVSDDFGREFFSIEQGVEAKHRQRGHSSEARCEKRAQKLDSRGRSSGTGAKINRLERSA